MFFLLLMDGTAVSVRAVMALLGLIAIVCCVANYGYALNEVFDIAEDRQGGRKNAASEMSPTRIWTIVSISALCACSIAWALAGKTGLLLTLAELCLPLAYSVPPLRLKERGWLGVFSDALAAHVYPVVVALLIVSIQSLAEHPLTMVFTALLWAAATGLRGILTHQLQSEEHDRAAGLSTVVHRIGYSRLKSFVLFSLLPLEVISFVALILQSDAKVFLKAAACIFLFFEYLKFRLQVFPVVVFSKAGERYIPFVDEGFYKVWGPLAFAADAALTSPFYLVLMPLCVFAFWPRVAWERVQLALTVRTAWARAGQGREEQMPTRPAGK